MKRILIIQTAFIGDVILATVLIEKLKDLYRDAEIDFLLRKGNEELLTGHPKLHKVLVWEKRHHKYRNLLKIAYGVRRTKYDLIVNVHRFSTSGLVCMFSGAKQICGFDKNPLSFVYDIKVKHEIGNGVHEVSRNLSLVAHLGGMEFCKPKLYFSESDLHTAEEKVSGKYVTIAPASVWFTKQFPKAKWVELVNQIPADTKVCYIGAGNDLQFCQSIIDASEHDHQMNLAGKLTMLESAALMKNAQMNYVNDSAPMHLASSVNAPTTAIFCSTVPEFGFGPLSDNSHILQVEDKLYCRPCGLHGFNACPEGHFRCAKDIRIPKSEV